VLTYTTNKLKETDRNISHSFNSRYKLWQLRYKPPNRKTAGCFFINGYLSEADAETDIPLLNNI
jgi:hypothetical protein